MCVPAIYLEGSQYTFNARRTVSVLMQVGGFVQTVPVMWQER